jgi:hypothetical protein
MDWAELARADVTVPETPEDVEKLADSITHRKRDFWIVVLTSRRWVDDDPPEVNPAVPPMVVREIVGPNTPIVHLKSRLATHLQTLLPPGLGVYGGALRIYRPGVFEDPFAHPLLYDATGEYGADILDWLGRLVTPSVTHPPSLSLEERVVTLEHALDQASRARRRETKILRRRYEQLIAADRPPGIPWPWGRVRPDRMETELRELIAEQWASFIPRSQQDKYPLRPYTVTSRLIEDLRGGVADTAIDEVARVCALVVCGFSIKAAGISVGPLRPSPDAPQMTKKDGSNAWWCNFASGASESAPRLVWWKNRCGSVELVAAGRPKGES